MAEQRSIKKNAFFNSLKTFLMLFFPLITFPYSSRILGPAVLGKVNFAQSIVSYFLIIATLGISSYALREIAKVRDDKVKLNTLIKELLCINIVSTVVAYIALFICMFFVKKIADIKPLIIICSTLILFDTFGLNWLYGAFEEYTYITIRSLVFQGISVVLLYVLVKTKDDYLQYAAVNVVSSAGANICNLVHARKFISLKKKDSLKMHIKRHLKPIFILFASGIAGTIFASLDASMLGFLSTNEQVGYYSAGAKLVKMVRNLFPAITSVMIPRIAYYYSHKDRQSIIELSTKTFNLIFCFAPPVAIGLLLLMRPLVLIFCGQLYLDAIMVSKIMCPFIVFSAVSAFTGGLLIIFNKEKAVLYRVIIAVVIDFVFNYFLIPEYGANGAAVATFFSELSIVLFDCFVLRDFLRNIKILRNILQFCLALIFMTFCVLFTGKSFTGSILQLTLGIAVGILSYGTILLVLKNEYLLKNLQHIFNTIKGRIK